jgi:CSLREA domain-containing protein
MTRLRLLRLAYLVLVVAALATATPAAALIFTVNSTADAVDAALDGTCATAAGVCTLRAALQEANVQPDEDTITLPAGKFALKLVGAGEDASTTGDLDVAAPLILNGAGVGVSIVSGKKDRVFDVGPGVAVTLRDLTVTKGKSGTKNDDDFAFAGGGIRSAGDLTLERVAVVGNSSSHEGGGIVVAGGVLTLTDVTVAKNKALDDGGGIELIDTTGTFTNVTINGNKAGDEGGGIHAVIESVVTLTNVTVSGNSSVEQGGGLRIESDAEVAMTNVTFAKNKTKDKEAGGAIDPSDDAGVVSIRNTILEKNKPVNCGGPLTLLGGNLESGTACGLPLLSSNIKKMGLGGLKKNGGPTLTHALKDTSPAVDSAEDGTCPPTDQRGFARVDFPGVGIRTCDIGAFELQPEP